MSGNADAFGVAGSISGDHFAEISGLGSTRNCAIGVEPIKGDPIGPLQRREHHLCSKNGFFIPLPLEYLQNAALIEDPQPRLPGEFLAYRHEMIEDTHLSYPRVVHRLSGICAERKSPVVASGALQ
jgi:hypothetical protein